MKQEKKNGILSNYLWLRKEYERLEGKRHHWNNLVYIVMSLLVPVISIAFPSVAVGAIQSKMNAGTVLAIIVGYAVVLKVSSVLLAYMQDICYMDAFLGRIKSDEVLFEHATDMDYEKLESKSGQIKFEKATAAVFRGNDYGIEAYYRMFPVVIINFIGFMIYSFIVSQINVWVLVYMLVSSVILVGISVRETLYEERNEDSMMGIFKNSARIFGETGETKYRHDLILYDGKPWMMSKLQTVVDGFLGYYKGIFRLSRTTGLVGAVIGFVRDLIVYGFLIYKVSQGKMSVEELLLFIGAVAGYSAWMQGMTGAVASIASQNHVISNYRDFLDFGNIEPMEDVLTFEENRGKIHELRLENVTYKYEGNEEATIKNVNLTLYPGEKVALVGENGAGKSTLVKLLTGLYTPTEGKIYMDGVDISTVDQEKYFKEFSVVFQDNVVIACSVAENVACTKNYDKEKVIKCLTDAGLYEKVCSMPNGPETMLTRRIQEDGVELSGGETQKLMLARALYRGAPTLVLDEPTAALDPIAESKMYETYTGFGKEKTSVFISHRLSSTRFCDRICFLQDGEIVEEGTHEQLMAKQGAYANMFNIQAKYYKEQEEGKYEEEI